MRATREGVALALREAARERFRSLGFPTTRNEDWKYTNVSRIAETVWQPASRDGPSLALEEALSPLRLVFVNGRLVPERSSLALPPGVSVVDSSESPGALVGVLERDATRGGAFSALNAASFEGGALVHVERGVSLEEPIELVFVERGQGAPTASHVRNLVRVEAGGAATIVETHAGAGEGPTFANVVTDVSLGEGASLEWLSLGEQRADASSVNALRVEQATGSRFSCRSFALGSGLTRNELSVLLAAPEAECELLGLYVLDGRAHTDNHLNVDHASPRCTSRQLYKGVVTGASRAVFDGRIFVREGASKTDARQTNKNLLLSDEATVDTKPNLRIYADDVKCAHGAAVGRLDEEAIFYLRSRGIDETSARAVLTLAFTREIVDRVPLDALRERILGLVRAKLGMTGGEA